ncbi:EpsG family protein [Psychrobacter sp. Ps2]|uniref:EpsG family protein n=1 Tax=Psychrobacter sp. Ps2 TaxID=2790956 RepID=UPI001EE10746|nr:EpsG family protein [Psychrobacter sp. Ps2]MCG3859940.1 EpsG family protein [Psychrobacter sp. Ps2]
MLPYLLVPGLVIFWVVLEKKSLNRTSFWLPLIALTLFAGVRSYWVGTDTVNYTRNFNNRLQPEYFRFNEDIEYGYQLLEYWLLHVTANYFWLLFITSFVIVYCYLSIIKKYSVNYWFSIFLFITLGVYTFSFNGLRQGIAMAMFTLATPYLLEKRLFPYLLVCAIGSLFHVTALFIIPFYFIVNLRVRPAYKIIATFFGSLLVSRLLVSYISSTNDRYEDYAKVSEESGGFLTLGFYTVLMLLIIIASYVYKIKDKNFQKLLTFYASGVASVIPLAMLGTNASGPQRLLSYFTWTLILILPVVLKKINNIYIYIISVFIFIIYFILSTSRFSDLSPYVINPIFKVF